VDAPRIHGAAGRPGLAGHIEICRFDHWTKHVFALPGVVVALAIAPERASWHLVWTGLVGLLALGIVSSSNYVLNELRDAETDAHHPEKASRPVPSGRVHVPAGYAQWILMGAAGFGLGFAVNPAFAAVLAFFWLASCAYNLPPLRTKDVPYLDVISEGINNPIRMLAGWYVVDPPAIAPASLLLSYWLIGCYFMAMKRLAEVRHLQDRERASAYRRSFAHYDENRLLISVMFTGSTAMLLLGAFIVRYRLELILSFHRQRPLAVAIAVCAAVMTLLMFVDVPALGRWFAPTAPTNPFP
jgi:4-hydroxybenzoate polyprenyltransferase